MSETEFIGLLVGALVVLIGLLTSIVKPLISLNSNITKLNSNFENMEERDRIRDDRINRHGKEIDSIVEQQRSNERTLSIHEVRISSLEEKVK